MSGKTTLARLIARDLRRRKQAVVVYDPVGTATAGGDWGKDTYITDDEETLWDVIAHSRSPAVHVFIDEAGDLFNLQRKENHWLLTRGRHMGFIVYLITQRPKMVAPSVRSQCGRCYMFRLATEDADEIGRDFGHSNLSRESLDRGDYLVLDSGARDYSRLRLPYHLKEARK